MVTKRMVSNIEVKVLKEGTMYMDGGACFGVIPRTDWSKQYRPDRQNRVRLGVNVMLVKHPDGNMLINTGIGSKGYDEVIDKYGHNTSKLMSALRRENLKPNDIDFVFLTHLHFDHAGGVTSEETKGQIRKLALTFPKATHIIHKTAWEDSQNLDEKSLIAYGPGVEDLELLEKQGKLKIIDGEHNVLLPQIEAVVAEGPTSGHCIVLVKAGSERYMYLSDLVPTPLHINKACINSHDRFPEQTLINKKHWLDKARDEGWLLVFAHGYDRQAAGYLNRKSFSPVDIWNF